MRTDDFASSSGAAPIGTRLVALLAVIGPRPVMKGSASPIYQDGDRMVYAYALASEALHAAMPVLASGKKSVAAVWLGEVGPDHEDMALKALHAIECADFGEPGQVVLTLAVVETARALMPEGTRLLELGNRQVADGQVERLFFVELEGSASSAAASLVDRDAPLRFIGRGHELAEIEDRITRYRLVTVTGPAGIGKTTLVRRVLDEMDPENAVWYLDASTLASPTLLCSALTETLDIRKRALQTHMEALLTGAEFRDGVLAIDASNREIPEVRAVVRALLSVAPNLAVVVAAPRSLRLPNESVFPLRGLGLPSGPEPWESLREYDALAFFESRAAAMVPNFNITRDNAEAVAVICKRLDGNPAALTLAVSKLRVLSPVQILDRLGQPLVFLKNAPGGGLERHQTLQQMIAVTVDPLAEGSKLLLARLAALEGAVSFDDVEAMFPKQASLPAFEELVDAGLLESLDSNPETRRFTLSRSVREFAFGALPQALKEEISDQRYAYFEQVALASATGLTSQDELAWARRMEAQLPDISATIRMLIRKGELERACMILVAGGNFWYVRNFPSEAFVLAEEILGKRGEFPSRARMENFAAVMALQAGDPKRAVVYASRALQRSEKEKLPTIQYIAHNTLGMIAHATRHFAESADHYRRGAQFARQLGDKVSLLTSLSNLIGVSTHTEGYDEVLAAVTEAFSIEDAETSISNKAFLRNNIANYFRRLGQFVEARKLVHEAITLLESSGYGVSAALEVRTLAHLLIDEKRYEDAAFFFGGAAALLSQDEGHLTEYERHETNMGVERVKVEIGAEKFDELYTAGRILAADDVIAAAIDASSSR